LSASAELLVFITGQCGFEPGRLMTPVRGSGTSCQLPWVGDCWKHIGSIEAAEPIYSDLLLGTGYKLSYLRYCYCTEFSLVAYSLRGGLGWPGWVTYLHTYLIPSVTSLMCLPLAFDRHTRKTSQSSIAWSVKLCWMWITQSQIHSRRYSVLCALVAARRFTSLCTVHLLYRSYSFPHSWSQPPLIVECLYLFH